MPLSSGPAQEAAVQGREVTGQDCVQVRHGGLPLKELKMELMVEC